MGESVGIGVYSRPIHQHIQIRNNVESSGKPGDCHLCADVEELPQLFLLQVTKDCHAGDLPTPGAGKEIRSTGIFEEGVNSVSLIQGMDGPQSHVC